MSKYVKVDDLQAFCDNQVDHSIAPNDFQRMNHIEVTLCKECQHWKPPHIRLNDGKQRTYKAGEKDIGPFRMGVTVDIGINVGGSCWVDQNCGYGRDMRVFRDEDDYCSRAKRLPEGKTSNEWWGLSEEPADLIDDF